MSKKIFSFIGGTVLVSAFAWFLLDCYVAFGYSRYKLPDSMTMFYVRSLGSLAYLMLAGIGLIFQRKWAALLISLPTGLCSAVCVKWSIEAAVDLHFMWWVTFAGAVLFAVLFAVPSVSTIIFWRTLVWRREHANFRHPTIGSGLAVQQTRETKCENC